MFSKTCFALCFLDGKLEDFGKRICRVLCRLRDEGDEAKEVPSAMNLVMWTFICSSLNSFLFKQFICLLSPLIPF